MKPRTLIALQFAMWAFFFSRLIPFSGEFLLPIVWIYDKRIFAVYLAFDLVDLLRLLPGAIAVIPLERFKEVPQWEIAYLLPLALAATAANVTFGTWVTAWWVRRKIRKRAPDLQRVL